MIDRNLTKNYSFWQEENSHYFFFSDRVGLEDEEAEDCYDSAPESDDCDEEINVT